MYYETNILFILKQFFSCFNNPFSNTDRNAAKAAFGKYLEGGNFTANQIRFVENIIDYLTQNGVINPELLYESPFTDIHSSGLDGVFNDDEADEIVALVRSFNENVDSPFRGVA